MSENEPKKKLSAGVIVLIIIGVVVVLSIVSCAICYVVGNNMFGNSDNPPYYPSSTQTPSSRGFSDEFTIKVLNKITGSEASRIISNENPFNPSPQQGETSYLLNVRVTCDRLGYSSYSEGAVKVTKSDIRVEMYGDKYHYSLFSILPSTYVEFPDGYLKEGESVSGWIYYIVPTGPASITMDYLTFKSNSVQL